MSAPATISFANSSVPSGANFAIYPEYTNSCPTKSTVPSEFTSAWSVKYPDITIPPSVVFAIDSTLFQFTPPITSVHDTPNLDYCILLASIPK